MPDIDFIERDMTAEELAQINAGFDQHATEHGNPPIPSKRYGFVVMDGETFVGCASGLTNDNFQWFYLTDLFIEKDYRGQGLGADLLQKMEKLIVELDIPNIWTWTAGYEAPAFYKSQGYTVFAEMKNWYVSGHSRIGLWKKLAD